MNNLGKDIATMVKGTQVDSKKIIDDLWNQYSTATPEIQKNFDLGHADIVDPYDTDFEFIESNWKKPTDEKTFRKAIYDVLFGDIDGYSEEKYNRYKDLLNGKHYKDYK